MARHRKDLFQKPDHSGVDTRREAALRIIGGTMRGRKLIYTGDLRTRPMKDRVREALFDLLGPEVVGRHAVDVFAGTGALALEALSRGATRATFVEQHFPTARVIQQNAALLDVAERCAIEPGNAFIWTQKLAAGDAASPEGARTDVTLRDGTPWVVFCSPPYAFYVERKAEMLSLISTLVDQGPAGSIFAVESDERFDMGQLPDAGQWDVRPYLPAVVAIYRKV